MTGEVKPEVQKDSVNLIGVRLRQAREERGLSLRSLASQIGVTASMLSQIETGQTNPSVDTLYAMAEGLGVPTCFFFEEEGEHARHRPPSQQFAGEVTIVHPESRRSITLADGVTWHSLLPDEDPDFEWTEIRYPPGATSARVMEQHSGKHYLVVLEGVLTIQLAFADYRLQAGDSLNFNASIPHRFRNDDPAKTAMGLVAVLKRRQP